MKAGDLDVTVFQNAAGQGKGAVDAALKLAKGEKVESKVWVPFELVTPENMDSTLPGTERRAQLAAKRQRRGGESHSRRTRVRHGEGGSHGQPGYDGRPSATVAPPELGISARGRGHPQGVSRAWWRSTMCSSA